MKFPWQKRRVRWSGSPPEQPGAAFIRIGEYAFPDRVEADIWRKAENFAAQYAPLTPTYLDFSRASGALYV